MTEQKKMAIPSLYSETEPIRKTGDGGLNPGEINNFGNIGTEESINDLDPELMQYGVYPYDSSQFEAIKDNLAPFKGEIGPDTDMEQFVKDQDAAYNKDFGIAKFKSKKILDRKRRRGKTADKRSETEPKKASFDHECNIWGNNLAGNREFYESITKEYRQGDTLEDAAQALKDLAMKYNLDPMQIYELLGQYDEENNPGGADYWDAQDARETVG